MITIKKLSDLKGLEIHEYISYMRFLEVYSHLLSPNHTYYIISHLDTGLYCYVVETDVGCDVITIFHTKTKKMRCSIYRRGLSLLRQTFGVVDGVGVNFRNKLY